MKVGIAVDDWKLPVFRRRLTGAGFAYEDAGALTLDTTLLRVITEDVAGLAVVVTACQTECAKQKR